MIRRLALALALALPAGAQTGRDTTIYTATRIITSTTGKITSVSVNKLAALPVGRVDTVRITRVDTVHVKDPMYTQYFFWTPYLRGDSIYWGFGSNNNDATMPKPIQAPKSLVGVTDTVFWQAQTTPARDSIYWTGPYPWPKGCVVGCRPEGFRVPVVHDTVRAPSPGTTVRDTLRLVWYPVMRATRDTFDFTLRTYDPAQWLGQSKPWSISTILGPDKYFYWYPMVVGDSIRFVVKDGPTGASQPPTIALPVRIVPTPTNTPVVKQIGTEFRVFYNGVEKGRLMEGSNRLYWRAFSMASGGSIAQPMVGDYATQADAAMALVDPTRVTKLTLPATATELPRTTLDTRMPAMPQRGDTLFAPLMGSTVWRCAGPTVALDPRCPQYNTPAARRARAAKAKRSPRP